MASLPARERFIELLRTAIHGETLLKLTLGKYRGPDATLQNLYVRPVTLKAGPQLAFVWRHATCDVTRNLPPAAALAELEPLIGNVFFDAHLFTGTQTAQFESKPGATDRIRIRTMTSPVAAAHPATAHDIPKNRLIAPNAPWLQALGVTNDRGQPREGMADKFRQIQKFAELLSHLIEAAGLAAAAADPTPPLQVVDMGSGKGYLTFAVAALLGDRARVRGIEARPELVTLCNRVARERGFGDRLTFAAGTIADTPLEPWDIVIALHACDTATDDALARGIQAGARLLVTAPCCQKEVRRQLVAPPILAHALRHGIFQERHAEFATDALRAELLEWAGYNTRVFEFISTEHTAKNLMIAGFRSPAPTGAREDAARRVRDLAAFYGVRQHRLAQHLGFSLTEIPRFVPENP